MLVQIGCTSLCRLSPPKLLPTEGNEVKVEEHGDTIVVVKVKEININYYQEEQSNTLR